MRGRRPGFRKTRVDDEAVVAVPSHERSREVLVGEVPRSSERQGTHYQDAIWLALHLSTLRNGARRAMDRPAAPSIALPNTLGDIGTDSIKVTVGVNDLESGDVVP